MLTRNRIVTGALALALLAFPLALTACGGSDAGEDSTAPVAESTSAGQKSNDTAMNQDSNASNGERQLKRDLFHLHL